MTRVFSAQLIKKCQKIFKERSGIELDEEQAELILERLARLGFLITKMNTQKGGEEYD